LKGFNIVVIEDELDAREFLAIALEQYGARVKAAASAAEGLRAVAAEVPDVILSDLGMPDEDGYSFIRKLRALPSNEGGQVPAIALTAFVRTEDRIRALESGFQLHFSKPIDPLQLVVAITNIARTRVDRPK
jgi:CheY-like chemotaxis protein